VAGGLSLDAALAEATRYSALSVTRHGAQKSFATEAEFAAFSGRPG
jgi:ribokinase